MSKSPKEREFVALNIAVLTVSDSRTEATDKSGKRLLPSQRRQYAISAVPISRAARLRLSSPSYLHT